LAPGQFREEIRLPPGQIVGERAADHLRDWIASLSRPRPLA
jgi:hypothetical protein